MTVRLSDLEACLEGVIPSIIATRSSDGIPNISYLSQVVVVDDRHVALTNQFLSKTAANIRSWPFAALLLVDARTGCQFALEIEWKRSEDQGALFDRVERNILAHAAQIGMGGVMRLRALEIFEVLSIRACESETVSHTGHSPVDMAELARHSRHLASAGSTEDLLDRFLEAASTVGGAERAVILLPDARLSVFTVIGSLGYKDSGVGSEVLTGEGLIGQAAASREIARINDVSRIHRLSHAVATHHRDERSIREIDFPQFGGAIGQVAIPLVADADLVGVLFLESSRTFAFDNQRCAALQILCDFAASQIADASPADSEPGVAAPAGPATPRKLSVTFYHFDGSIFIEDKYVIKGVAGRLLLYMLEKAAEEGRMGFTNREIRLAPDLQLPEFKDNLETRLILLKRRLAAGDFGVTVTSTGRGQMELKLDGTPVVTRM